VGLVIIAVIGSVISISYYFKPIISMYSTDEIQPRLSPSKSYMFYLILISVLNIIIGFFPMFFIRII
jgi:NADH-quinone oxidoreductase subunit N